MNTQVIFKIDKKLKDQAMKKAQSEGLPFGVVLKLATKAFVEGNLNIGIVANESFNKSTTKDINKALADIKAGKNLSPRFSNANEGIAFLKK